MLAGLVTLQLITARFHGVFAAINGFVANLCSWGSARLGVHESELPHDDLGMSGVGLQLDSLVNAPDHFVEDLHLLRTAFALA